MLLNKNFSNTINLTGENTVCTIKTPEMLIGKSLQQSKLRKKYGINILAVKTGNEKDNMYIPDARYKLKSDDVLILTGNTHKIEIFLDNINKQLNNNKFYVQKRNYIMLYITLNNRSDI